MIEKIKIKGQETEVFYFINASTTEKTTKVYSAEQRAPEFTKTLDELVPKILKFLELPLHFAGNDNVIKEVGFYSIDGLVTHLYAKLKIHTDDFLGNLELKTPLLWNKQIGSSLSELITHAENFINGKRAQRDLFIDIGTAEITQEVFE